jgi:hypothetical protein
MRRITDGGKNVCLIYVIQIVWTAEAKRLRRLEQQFVVCHYSTAVGHLNAELCI